jgi:hypothetical protein
VDGGEPGLRRDFGAGQALSDEQYALLEPVAKVSRDPTDCE